MKNVIYTSRLVISLACVVPIATGCGKVDNRLDTNWASPSSITVSGSGLGGWYNLYKCQNTVIALQASEDKSARCFLMNRDTKSWSEAHLTGVPHRYFGAEPDLDQAGNRVMYEQGYTENDQLVMNALVGQLTVADNVSVRTVQDKQWLTEKSELFETNRLDAKLSDPGKRGFPHFGMGVINATDLYIPYCLDGCVVTYYGQSVRIERGPFVNGVFHSLDGGTVWQMERIADLEAMSPAMCQSKHYYYYFVTGRDGKIGRKLELWFTRKKVEANGWDTPKPMTKTFAGGGGQYVVAAVNDTVHVCWLDRRNNKWRFNLEGPNIENDEVVYCHQKDSDNGWSKDVILSKGLLYSYAPSMSVEGDDVVVAWSGIQTADKNHTDYGPNDIYYATSKDGGNSWSKPLKVTDSAKDGVTSGEPKVMLLNGVIHLFYIQGKRELQQLSFGLTKLNQPPWPIYYTQRPFPK